MASLLLVWQDFGMRRIKSMSYISITSVQHLADVEWKLPKLCFKSIRN